MDEPVGSRRRSLIARGVVWTGAYQIFEAGLAVGAMLVLVRLIPPAEYGRFGAVLGFLTLVNSFSSGVFTIQALQLADGRAPDWSLHWSAGLYIQSLLTLICHAFAGLCWLAPAYRPLAPLLHLAAFGLMLDWPAQLRAVMLRRQMDFPRLKILLAFSTVAKLAVTLLVGLTGGGAYAIVLGSNVVTPLPLAIDLLLVCRWRPRPGWWRWPDWTAYRPAIRFGLQQATSALLGSARGALGAAVLPGALGYTAIGLLNRAQALFGMSIGRAAGIVVETAYPLLPRYVSDAKLYARQATLFAQVLFLMVLPGALYVGLEGHALSRLLYGERWIAADPLIWPAALTGLGLAIFAAASGVLLAANCLRLCLVLDVMVGALSLPMMAVAWASGSVVAYAWVVAAGQLVAGVMAMAAASSRLASGWARPVLLPPALASFLATAAVLVVESRGLGSSSVGQLWISTGVYGLTLGLTLRGFFPGALASLLSRIPGGDRLSSWLRLPMAGVASPAP